MKKISLEKNMFLVTDGKTNGTWMRKCTLNIRQKRDIVGNTQMSGYSDE